MLCVVIADCRKSEFKHSNPQNRNKIPTCLRPGLEAADVLKFLFFSSYTTILWWVITFGSEPLSPVDRGSFVYNKN